MTDCIINPWPNTFPARLTLSDFDPIIEHKPEIILFGADRAFEHVTTETLALIQNLAIGIEMMQPDAAIRSYNVLVDEQRNVALALLLSTFRQFTPR